MIYGVFGDPVAHSLSPAMHNAAYSALEMNCVYVPFHVGPGDLPQAVRGIRALNIGGVNLTIPHKQAILSELDEIEGDSLFSGSVNTVINRNGRLVGTSTDGSGFLQSLREEGHWDPNGAEVLMLGAGGSAAALIYSLISAKVKTLTVLNRDVDRAVQLREQVGRKTGFTIEAEGLGSLGALERERYQLLINTTSVGLHEDQSLIAPAWFHSGLLVYDLVYRRGGTQLLREAREAGCRTLSGLSLLLYQGAQSFSLWFNQEAPIEKMREALQSSEL